MKVNDYLGEQGVAVKIILKRIFKKVCVKHAVDSSGPGWSSPQGSCENGTGLPGSLKGTEFLGEVQGPSASPETQSHRVASQSVSQRFSASPETLPHWVGSQPGTLGFSRNTAPLGRQSARDSWLLQKHCPTG
jgi:hypothetical protein